MASAIRDGQADVGIGLRAAAEAFDLDFIPLVKEEYDFVIRKDRLEKESVQFFIETLRADTTIKRLTSMKGFHVNEKIGSKIINDE